MENIRKLTILCAAISATGHMNAMIGIAIALKKKGHRVVFAVEKSWQGKLAKFSIEEEVYEEREKVEVSAGKQWSEHMTNFEEIISKSKPEEKMQNVIKVFEKLIEAAEFCNPRFENIIEKIKPDLIVEDFVILLPAFVKSNVPIIKMYSVAPLIAFNDLRLPPRGCGLPLKDQSDWKRCRQIVYGYLKPAWKKARDWFENQCPNYLNIPSNRTYHSANLNIYLYPKSLVDDYLTLCPMDDTWINVDHCLRAPFGEFKIPEKLQILHGQLIYFSLGSIATSFVGLMKRLIGILANSKHKFIVSLGHRSYNFELADNMWGEPVIPQLAVLPHADLVITHGGNNSFTEVLYFGKPMIVLPLFGDQYDNAQRAVETNIGRRFNPFTVSENELINAIDELLSDVKITENLKLISKQIQESDSMDKAVDRIELVAKNPKFPTIV